MRVYKLQSVDKMQIVQLGHVAKGNAAYLPVTAGLTSTAIVMNVVLTTSAHLQAVSPAILRVHPIPYVWITHASLRRVREIETVHRPLPVSTEAVYRKSVPLTKIVH